MYRHLEVWIDQNSDARVTPFIMRLAKTHESHPRLAALVRIRAHQVLLGGLKKVSVKVRCEKLNQSIPARVARVCPNLAHAYSSGSIPLDLLGTLEGARVPCFPDHG